MSNFPPVEMREDFFLKTKKTIHPIHESLVLQDDFPLQFSENYAMIELKNKLPKERVAHVP